MFLRSNNMKQNNTITRGIAALILVAAFAACGGSAGAVSLDGLEAYLGKLPANTPDKPAAVGISGANVSVEWNKISSLVRYASRYVILDLSACITNDNTFVGGFDYDYDKFIIGLILPKGITSIGRRAFDKSSLTAITIPASVTNIGEEAFARCEKLTSVTFEGSVVKTFGNGAFPVLTQDEYSGFYFTVGSNALRTAYEKGGAGTYTLSGETWTKQ
jgi:hypothetical protein